MTTPTFHAIGEQNHAETLPKSQRHYRRVTACVDASPVSLKVIAHGVTIANALGAELILMHVLDAEPDRGTPSDPIEWDLRRREACSHVEMLARDRADEVGGIQAHVVQGRAAEQICKWARNHQVDLTVVCTRGDGDAREWELGGTARRIIDCVPGSVLLVPACVEESQTVRYRRILVPLDGSSRAESALPIALRVAEAQSAEIVLVHAVPEPELTEIGPLEREDEELRKRVLCRNERVAQVYLDRIHTRIADKGVSIRTLMLRGGDARHLLSRAILDQSADLTILTSHGRSGHLDVAAGSVTAFLIAHAAAPLLIVRHQSAASTPRERAAPNRSGIRLPSAAIP
ncbi:MAG: universal stress protein [Pseudomonadales bacterium]